MLRFSTLLLESGIDPGGVRLLRHQEKPAAGRPSPFGLWRNSPDEFDGYQQTQGFGNAALLAGPIWASFVGLPDRETLFVGLYNAELVGPLAEERFHPVRGLLEPAGSCNRYHLSRRDELADYSGRLFIDWGIGFRSWIQRADRQDKVVVELKRTLQEPEFPGYPMFHSRLSEMESMPASWRWALSSVRGIYILSCPRTNEQYVGSATGVGGFLARWKQYAVTGHGGNLELKSREASDYRVAILETAGSAASETDILKMEALWKVKLGTRESGLNRN